MKTFFDTETTGKAAFRLPPEHPSQPRIVQLAALLTSDEGQEVASVNLIIKPEGWDIPLDAAMIHGITTEKAHAWGISILSALSVFSGFCRQSDTLVAHNIDFDYLMALIEYNRTGKPHRMEAMKRFCTMKSATEICRLPGQYGYKWPKLSEAYKHFFNEEFEGAHDALADVRGCAKVYFEMQKLAEKEAVTA